MFDIFTDVVAFMKWINGTLVNLGGMQACDLVLEKTHPIDLPTETTLPDAPLVLEDRIAILAGGFSPFFPNSPSTEAFPSAGCSSLPALPQFRGGHALFPTAEENPSIVACGGTDENR